MSIISGYMVPHPPIAVHEIGRGEEKKIQDTLDAYDAVAKDIARQHHVFGLFSYITRKAC